MVVSTILRNTDAVEMMCQVVSADPHDGLSRREPVSKDGTQERSHILQTTHIDDNRLAHGKHGQPLSEYIFVKTGQPSEDPHHTRVLLQDPERQPEIEVAMQLLQALTGL